MRLPTARRICASALLFCAGIVLLPAYKHWVATRTWVAVDTPISMAPGHVKIENFRVNLAAVYDMQIELNGYDYWRYPKCYGYEGLQVRWWLSRDGHVVSTWRDYWGGILDPNSNSPMRGPYLGTFYGSGGLYNLDVEIASDATCLQAFHPRLRVFTDESDYSRGWIFAMALLASCGLVGISVGFLVVSLISEVQGQAQPACGESLPIFDTLRIERESTRRKLLLMGPESALPTVGSFCALTSLILFLGYAPFVLVNWQRSYGIPVRLLRPGLIQASSNGQTGLLVYVDRNDNLYLDSKRLTPEELVRALQAEFARRADWSVYVDGDSDAKYASVVRAMDLVRKAQGKVIMVTPSLRAEAEARRH